MLTPELLITYGFEKDLATPLEKWSFEHLKLHIEKKANSIYFRIYDIKDPSLQICIYTEAHFLQFLRIIDVGGSLGTDLPESSIVYFNSAKASNQISQIQHCQMN